LEILREKLERAGRILDFEVVEEAGSMMNTYLEELYRWNRAYNLVGRKTTWEGLVGHAIDSLTPLLYAKLFEKDTEMLDLGTGAGLPGIPLYIIKGPLDMSLAEPVRKKNSFLRHIRRKLCLESLKVVTMRAEEMSRSDEYLNGYERIFMRAVADPAQAAKLARPLLSSGGALTLFLGKEAGETLSRRGKDTFRPGMQVENIRSTKKVTGRDTYIAILRKAE
jgi:16S rRNA (guanine527-N7)-methyltransferase